MYAWIIVRVGVELMSDIHKQNRNAFEDCRVSEDDDLQMAKKNDR